MSGRVDGYRRFVAVSVETQHSDPIFSAVSIGCHCIIDITRSKRLIHSHHDSPEFLVSCLFKIAPMPEFEDGMDNLFSEGICQIVKEFGNKGVDALETYLVVTDNVSCVGEALRTLGRVDDIETADSRLRLLVLLLKHRSAIVRDAAAVGLAYLGDQRAIPAMTEAIEIEPLSLLRSDMEAIIADFERKSTDLRNEVKVHGFTS